jgi:hypothetical protein
MLRRLVAVLSDDLAAVFTDLLNPCVFGIICGWVLCEEVRVYLLDFPRRRVVYAIYATP